MKTILRVSFVKDDTFAITDVIDGKSGNYNQYDSQVVRYGKIILVSNNYFLKFVSFHKPSTPVWKWRIETKFIETNTKKRKWKNIPFFTKTISQKSIEVTVK